MRQALTGRFGPEVGREATADALLWAWEHWDELGSVSNQMGYLYRVGQSAARRYRLQPPTLSHDLSAPDPEPRDPGLDRALANLSENQRTAVVLVHGFGWKLREVADLLDIKVTTVQNHLDRGMSALSQSLGVHP